MVCLTHCLHGQVLRETYHDKEEKFLKETYYVTDTITNILEGPYTSYYLNGQMESRGQFVNNETTGSWEFFFETGSLKMRGDVRQNSNDGYWEYFYESGKKLMEGEVIDHQRSGEWIFYFENGQVKERGEYVANKREGLWKFFYENGTLLGQVTYTRNQGRLTEYYDNGQKKAAGPVVGSVKTGEWTFFSEDGYVAAKGFLSQGEKQGAWEYYHSNGTISATGEYTKDAESGEWSYFYPGGALQSKGVFTEGKKEGTWKIYYTNGNLLGEGNYQKGTGPYKEYYPSGALKLEGQMKDGMQDGFWKYYHESGTLEGQCTYEQGRGEYTGFHPGGSIKTKGIIEDGKKKGTWEIYEKNGDLAGYYKPIYDTKPPVISERVAVDYGVGEYRFKGRKKGYFEPRLNEMKGLIVGFNPLMSLLGRVPLAIELYHQERLGHELEIEGIRDPFFKADNEVSLEETYTRGITGALRQKFYNDGGRMGLWYFGHEVRYSNLDHYANVAVTPDVTEKQEAEEWKIEYSLLLGYRLMADKGGSGLTLDGYIGAGTGYRSFSVAEEHEEVFADLPQESVTLRISYGINIGYVFRLKKGGR
jgi:antitoxin component YwqK of YwqJK toxin-antitoxin module